MATDSGMKRIPTDQLIEEQKKGAPIILCVTFCAPACCCFWIPLLFFLGAANVLQTCENYESFTVWLRTYGLVPMCCGIFFQLLVTFTACCGNHTLFKLALRLQILTGCVSVGMMIWGWVEWSRTEEEPCVGNDDINPRTLALVFLILGSIGAPSVLAGALYKGLCGDVNMRKVKEPEGV
mmetsp:Transcript_63254/g.100424  ORF Transcript_63254/g.100424 Transcript_63254/m.100424 type:complete len:180 (-) Transcript_63254:116-655(-)